MNDTRAAAKSNFGLAFRLLPQPRRDALHAFYALCRELDDIADGDLPLSEKRQALAQQRRNLGDVPSFLKRFDVDPTWIPEIINGVEMDLASSEFATFEQLYPYCYRVAGVVGMVCTRIFGCRSDAALKYAEALGVAFQLTNIMRDVGADLDLGRIYLPQDELQRFGINRDALRSRQHTPQFAALMQYQYERAKGFYALAESLLPANERRELLPARLMTQYYRAILEKLRRRDYPVLTDKVRLSGAYKLSLLGLYAAKQAMEGR